MPRTFPTIIKVVRAWAEQNGVQIDHNGNLYATSSKARRKLPLSIRGEGKLTPTMMQDERMRFALLTPGDSPTYADALNGWDKLGAKLLADGLIAQDGRGQWYIT